MRVGEARYVRELLDKRLQANPEARIIVCGDFNDYWNSTAIGRTVDNFWDDSGSQEAGCDAGDVGLGVGGIVCF